MEAGGHPRSDRINDRRTVLIVEDDDSTARATAYHLARAGYATSISRDGLAAITALKAWRPDALVLDLMLPHVDGLSIIEDVRRWAPDLPIVVMTARQEERDRLEALRRGADDLLRKPFSARELIARLEAIFRRAEVGPHEGQAVGEVSMGDLEVDQGRLEVRVAGATAPLTPLETKLLWILLEEKGPQPRRDLRPRLGWRARPGRPLGGRPGAAPAPQGGRGRGPVHVHPDRAQARLPPGGGAEGVPPCRPPPVAARAERFSQVVHMAARTLNLRRDGHIRAGAHRRSSVPFTPVSHTAT
jgi:DNA-binding response OmpR family regulator